MAEMDRLTDEFYDSCCLLVTDDEYDQQHLPDGRDNPLFVHGNCRATAEAVLGKFQGGTRLVLLCSQMQSGKTSVMRHLAYLLNVQKQNKSLKIDRDSMYVLINIADNTLLKQTQDRLEGVMTDTKMNVFHSASSNLADKSALGVRLSNNRVLVIDESHYGTDVAGRIARTMINYNSPLYNNPKAMQKHNVYVMLVSATPFSELGFNTNRKDVVTLKTVGTNYYGLADMLREKRIVDTSTCAMLNHDATDEHFRVGLTTVMGSFTRGFIFIRENCVSKKGKAWVVRFKAFLSGLPKDANGLGSHTFLSFNATTSKTVMDVYKGCVSNATYLQCRGQARKLQLEGLDAMLAFEPDRLVIVFVQRMLLAGNVYYFKIDLSMHNIFNFIVLQASLCRPNLCARPLTYPLPPADTSTPWCKASWAVAVVMASNHLARTATST